LAKKWLGLDKQQFSQTVNYATSGLRMKF